MQELELERNSLQLYILSVQTLSYQDGPLLMCLGWPLALKKAWWMQEWELQKE